MEAFVNQEVLVERFFQALTLGDRGMARGIINETVEAGINGEDLTTELFWPTLHLIYKLRKADQLSTLQHGLAVRLMRNLADQTQMRLGWQERNGRRVLAMCGNTEPDELSAAMACDLIEAGGFEVAFAGGGIPTDEVIARVGEDRPDILLLFASAAADLPEVRRLIDELHNLNVCPSLQVVVGGGVYGRAEGLAEEIGADLYLPDLRDVVEVLLAKAERRAAPSQRTVGKKRLLKPTAA